MSPPPILAFLGIRLSPVASAPQLCTQLLFLQGKANSGHSTLKDIPRLDTHSGRMVLNRHLESFGGSYRLQVASDQTPWEPLPGF